LKPLKQYLLLHLTLCKGIELLMTLACLRPRVSLMHLLKLNV
jgi:hypothetical protein